LLGGLSAAAGWLWASDFRALATVILAGAIGLIISGYIAASRRDTDATTEVAALIVVTAGVLAGTGFWTLSSGMIAITAILLVEKSRLHSWVARIPDVGLKAGFRFAVMALVIFPLLPEGPFGPLGGIRPRELWMMVLLFSGISFLAYIVRSFLGEGKGYVVAGLLGGLISSTNVTLSFSRASSAQASARVPLALGVVAASTMLCFRVEGAAFFLNPAFGKALVPYLFAPAVFGAIFTAYGFRRWGSGQSEPEKTSNPLQFRSAFQMALLFQIVLFLVTAARQRWGQTGLLFSGAILGFTDVDALVISMAKAAGGADQVQSAAIAASAGILANNVLKLGLAGTLGRGRFRSLAVLGLGILAIATGLSIAYGSRR
jgi:uncharacterized membrane protein (DUF4010 family)